MAEEKREGTGRDPIDELVDEITGNVNWDDPKWQDTMPDWPCLLYTSDAADEL